MTVTVRRASDGNIVDEYSGGVYQICMNEFGFTVDAFIDPKWRILGVYGNQFYARLFTSN